MSIKIGQEVRFKKDFKIKSFLTEETIEVKKGDKGFYDSRGILNFTTGAAKGKKYYNKEDKLELKGYDHKRIAQMVYETLINNFDIFIEDYGIEKEEFIDEIAETLASVL